MGIYDESGDIDFDAAARDLEASARIQNDGIRRDTVARIQTAALLDIAVSLRVLAAEAGAAMGLPEPAPEIEPVEEIERDFLVVGDLVHLIGSTDPGEVVRVGSDNGDPWADVDFATAKGVRYYWRNLERLIGDADSAEPFNPEVAATLNAEADGEPDLDDAHGFEDYEAPAEELVDDIDADFDGDAHAAAEAALERLRENEAKRKAEKKTTKKGTKK